METLRNFPQTCSKIFPWQKKENKLQQHFTVTDADVWHLCPNTHKNPLNGRTSESQFSTVEYHPSKTMACYWAAATPNFHLQTILLVCTDVIPSTFPAYFSKTQLYTSKTYPKRGQIRYSDTYWRKKTLARNLIKSSRLCFFDIDTRQGIFTTL